MVIITIVILYCSILHYYSIVPHSTTTTFYIVACALFVLHSIYQSGLNMGSVWLVSRVLDFDDIVDAGMSTKWDGGILVLGFC